MFIKQSVILNAIHKKMNYMFLLLGALSILLIGCSQSTSILNYKEIDIGCLPGLIGSPVRLVIRNQQEYDALLITYFEETKKSYKELWGVTTDEELNKGMPFKDCDAKLTPIDFKTYILLSHYAQGSGCTAEFNKDVQMDKLNKKVIFTIDVVEIGSCAGAQLYRSSVLISRIPDDYAVDFKVV